MSIASAIVGRSLDDRDIVVVEGRQDLYNRYLFIEKNKIINEMR